MSPAEWAEVFRAGWNAPDLHAHMPAGNAVGVALEAMGRKCEEITERRKGKPSGK